MLKTSSQPASIRILELDLAASLTEITQGKDLPIEKRVATPRPGSLCEQIIDALADRAEVNKCDLYARHTLTIFSAGEYKINFDCSVSERQLFVVLNFPTVDERKVSREFFQLASATLTNNYLALAQEAGDSALRAHASESHLFMPNFAYARQNETHKQRGPITAAIVARNLEPYYKSITSFHLHSPSIEGMASPGVLTNISPNEIFAPSFVCRDPDTLKPIDPSVMTLEGVNKLFSQFCIVAPDTGAATNARDFARYVKKLAAIHLKVDEDAIVDIPMAQIDKRRPGPNVSEVMNVLGRENVNGRIAVMFDDMFDTLGSIIKASEALRQAGAKSIEAIGTHGYFSGKGLENLTNSPISRLMVTNSMDIRPSVLEHPKITAVSIAPILAQVIADRVTTPEANLLLKERYPGPNGLREIGRYVPTMMPHCK